MIVDQGQHFLYRHIRLDKNEPFYIGIGTKITDYKKYKREYIRAYSKKGRNYIWEGIDNRTDFNVEILLESDNYQFINEKEQEFITLYGKIIDETGMLSNFTDGGGGILGLTHDNETKKNISKNSIKYKVAQYSLNGKFIRLWDSAKQFSEFYNCSRSPIYNCLNGKSKTCQDTQLLKIFTEDVIPKKLNEVLHRNIRSVKNKKGYRHSEETREKIRKANTGKSVSDQTKEKLRLYNLGNVQSPEAKQKQIEAQMGRDGNTVKHVVTGEVFNSLAKACRKFKLDYKNEHYKISKDHKNKNFIKVE